jgi:hypothetical protein
VALKHGETEGTLRGRSATFQELDSAQTLPVRMFDAQIAKLLGLTKATKGGLPS